MFPLRAHRRAGPRHVVGWMSLAIACAHAPPPPPLAAGSAATLELIVPGSSAWTPSGLEVGPGDTVEFWAAGEVRIAGWRYQGRADPEAVGPRGTYLYPNEDAAREYPLAAGSLGPAPLFALLGRIGDHGAPFLVGEHRTLAADQAGELQLGINDFDVSDNSGAFRVGVRVGPPGETLPPERPDARPVVDGIGIPDPVDDSHVLLVFIDGMRYDALKEMAFAGYAPNIRRLFFDGGVDVEQTSTIFPSNTVPATTAMLTGSWPDRSGLSTQMVFDREAGRLSYLLGPFSPADVGRRFQPDWWQGRPRADGSKLLGQWVAEAGETFSSTVLPVNTLHPPDLFFHRLANEAPVFGAHLVKDHYIDRTQTSFAIEQVVSNQHRVMMIWYTGVDTAGHRSPRGIWGESRRDLVRIDQDLARLEAALEREGIGDRTYWVLHADHGTSGGREVIHQSYDLANEFFYESLRDGDGDGEADAGGGLGMNVIYQVQDVPLLRRHRDLPEDDFMVCASQAYTVAWVALPRGDIQSRDWSALNSYFDLKRYGVSPGLAPVDIPRRLLDLRARGNLYEGLVSDHPVHLLFFPLSPGQLLVLGQEDSMALIEQRPDASGSGDFEYRYRVLEAIDESPEGVRVALAAYDAPDPLGYREEPALAGRLEGDPEWLGRWHDDREWLAATAPTSYPDVIVRMSRNLLGSPGHSRIDPNERFDFVAVSSAGWNFGPGGHRVGVDHGSPDRSSSHIPFLIRGPNLPQGVRVNRPARILDILPTVLELAGIPYDPGAIDGQPVREIWGTAPPPAAKARAVPFYLDQGRPVPDPDPTHRHPALSHDFENWHDLHNVAANFGALFSQELVRLSDLMVDFALPGRSIQPIASSFDAAGGAYGELPDGKLKRRPAEFWSALRLRNITLGELLNPVRSLQHVDRVVGVLRWVGDVARDLVSPVLPDKRESAAGGRPLEPLLRGVLHVRRSAVEGIGRLVHSSVEGVEGGIRTGSQSLDRARWHTLHFETSGELLAIVPSSSDVP